MNGSATNPWDVPCSRYEGGEDDDRVRFVFGYALGLLGGGETANATAQRIARLYDYKGTLYVAIRALLTREQQEAFRKAWAEAGYEVSENVEFTSITSPDWERVWDARRFDSDWKP